MESVPLLNYLIKCQINRNVINEAEKEMNGLY